MRRFCCLLLVIGSSWLGQCLAAETPAKLPPPPTEQYLRVCEIINRADRAFASSAPAEALATYREASRALTDFRKEHPTWNAPLVEVRAKHVGDRVKLLEQNPPAAAALAAIAPTPAAPSGPLPQPRSADVTNEFRIVLQELRAAEADNALLLAKLREALASTPAMLDPRELQRAEQSINTLKSENQQLRQQLEAALNGPAATASTTAGSPEVKRLRREIEDLNRKLTAQADAAVELLAEKAAELNRQAEELTALKSNVAPAVAPALADLQKENTRLKEQLRAAQTGADSGRDAAARLSTAQAKLNDATARIASLERELANRPGPASTKTSDRLKEENRTLQSQLDAMRKERDQAAQQAKRGQDAAQQLESARAEVAALQQTRKALETQLAAAPKAEALNQMEGRVSALQQQLTDANQRLAEARARGEVPPPSSVTAAEIAALRARAQEAESDTAKLRKENARLQEQAAKDAAQVRNLETRVGVLEKQLAETERQVSGRSTRSLEKKLVSLNDDVLALRARLKVYETKAVPYTKEELALFQTPAANRVVAQKSLPSKTSRGMTAELETRGERQLAAGELPQAEQTLTEVVQVNEREVRALCNLANSQAGQGKLTEADTTINRALALAPNDASSLAVLGFIRYSQSKPDEALDPLTRAAMLKPKDPGIQVLLGVTLAEKGQRLQAETAFRKALQLQPNHADAHRNLAVIYLTQKPPRAELARWHYQKAVANGSPPSADVEREIEAAAAGTAK